MSAAPKPNKLTVAEYLAVEREAEVKSEFFDGVMYPVYRDGLQGMAGASPPHNAIKENLVGELFGRLKGGPCRSYSSDQRVRLVPGGLFAYPDIVIVCGAPEFDPEDPHALVNPQVVIEVLSPSTERYDRGFKFRQLQQVPSVQEYVLVAQDEPVVERFVRQPDGTWVLTTFADLAGDFALGTVDARVPLADVYRGVTFPESPPR